VSLLKKKSEEIFNEQLIIPATIFLPEAQRAKKNIVPGACVQIMSLRK
jgi:hypothetical protein